MRLRAPQLLRRCAEQERPTVQCRVEADCSSSYFGNDMGGLNDDEYFWPRVHNILYISMVSRTSNVPQIRGQRHKVEETGLEPCTHLFRRDVRKGSCVDLKCC